MVNILIWNVNALVPTVKNILLKHGSFRGFFDEHAADIICFQETKLMEEKLTEDLACVEGYESFWTFSQKKRGYSGVATFVREEWSPVAAEIDSLGKLDTDLNGEGRIIITDHGSFVLLNVYVPNAGKKGETISERADFKIRFLHALKEKCDSLQEEGKKVVLVGDMNIAASTKDVHPALNWARMYHKEELSIMQGILSRYTDVWRKQNPGVTDSFTVWDEKTFARAINKGVRIDYVLVSPDVLPGVGTCQILDTPHKWSDHAALLVDIQGLQSPSSHEPVPESSRRLKKFDKRKQRSIASMFAGRKPSDSLEQSMEQSMRPAVSASLSKADSATKLLSEAVIPKNLKEPEKGEGEPSDAKRLKKDTESETELLNKVGNVVNDRIGLEDRVAQNPALKAIQVDSQIETSLDKRKATSRELKSMAKKEEKLKREKGQQGIKNFFKAGN